LVVGAQTENSSGVLDAGSAYIFSAATGALLATLASTSPLTYGGFGSAVAIGTSTVVVGAPYETAGASAAAGHAYVFTLSGSLVSTLTSPNAQTGGWFGRGVATVGSDVVVGAPNEAASGLADAGHAYQS